MLAPSVSSQSQLGLLKFPAPGLAEGSFRKCLAFGILPQAFGGAGDKATPRTQPTQVPGLRAKPSDLRE
jgi:hypothetical protein